MSSNDKSTTEFRFSTSTSKFESAFLVYILKKISSDNFDYNIIYLNDEINYPKFSHRLDPAYLSTLPFICSAPSLYLYITKNTYSKFTDQHPPVKIVSSANFADYEKAVNGCVALPVSLPSTSGNLPIITVSNHSSFENHLTSKVSELPKNHYLLVVPIDSHFLYGLMNGICLPRHDDTYMLTIGLNYHYTPYSAMTTCGFLGFIQTTDKTLEFFRH